MYNKSADKYVIDPHTAVGVATSYSFIAKDTEPINTFLFPLLIQPFSEVVNKALDSFDGYSFDKDVLPAELKALSSKEKRIKLIDEASVEKSNKPLKMN